ncbi:hypothetical protein V1512DRAFT_291814 [Lipomyces arxii]|uniref:uncharacterized protein n=1 Tax=Lipomyces arxii TaxID=56418 RepID=UPI0034CECD2F
MTEDSTQATFNELSKLETDFEKAEVQILKYSLGLLKPLYERRKELVKNIENFWAFVLQQAGEDFDQYLTPQDAELIEEVSDILVERDDVDPRTFTITFTFNENDFMDTTVLAKKFTYIEKKDDAKEGEDSEDITGASRIRYSSTKVPITWKEGKNLTETTEGSPFSFFTFFDWVGGEDSTEKDIFDKAPELALFFVEELYPNAVKLYTEAVDDEDDDSDEEEIDLEDDEEEDDEEEPPRKKNRQ